MNPPFSAMADVNRRMAGHAPLRHVTSALSAITAVASATKTVRNMPSPARVIMLSWFLPAVE